MTPGVSYIGVFRKGGTGEKNKLDDLLYNPTK